MWQIIGTISAVEETLERSQRAACGLLKRLWTAFPAVPQFMSSHVWTLQTAVDVLQGSVLRVSYEVSNAFVL